MLFDTDLFNVKLLLRLSLLLNLLKKLNYFGPFLGVMVQVSG